MTPKKSSCSQILCFLSMITFKAYWFTYYINTSMHKKSLFSCDYICHKFALMSLLVILNISDVLGEVMAVVKLDNLQVAQTSWKSHSQQCWDHRISIELDRVSHHLTQNLYESGLDKIQFLTITYKLMNKVNIVIMILTLPVDQKISFVRKLDNLTVIYMNK